MDDKTLADIVRQLDGEPRVNDGLEAAGTPVPVSDSDSWREELFEGLRATEWMLSDLRERCRQLYGYRMRLIDQLQHLDDAADTDSTDEWTDVVVPGPLALQ